MGLYQAAAEQRLHIHPAFKNLLAELAVFEVHADGKATDGEAAVPSSRIRAALTTTLCMRWHGPRTRCGTSPSTRMSLRASIATGAVLPSRHAS
ncbi:hypothetical protein AB5I41_04635 [Sphingomonas sp. MMS24-JH45]